MKNYSEYITINRRYSRSVNLERDTLEADSILGYVPTQKSAEVIERILQSMTTPRSTSAWTLTGVYGTGKSSLAHILSALSAPHNEPIYRNALHVIQDSSRFTIDINTLLKKLPSKGLIRAIVTAQREPVANTLIKALFFGISQYPFKGRKPAVVKKIDRLRNDIEKGKNIANEIALKCLHDLALKSNILLIIDELGKNLEYVACNHLHEDLYLLQQIAELPSGPKDPRIFFLSLLHQAFSEYANYLTIAQKNEWGKIQGRFEDIPFIDSTSEMFQLIGHTLDHSKLTSKKSTVDKWAQKWSSLLKKENYIDNKVLTKKNVSAIFPLHPLSAIVLPILCNRYAQNDRSLFSFLSSREPHSLTHFLDRASFARKVETLKLETLYDYFVESAGLSSTLRIQNQRWIEIHGRISDAIGLDADALAALKVIGLLNLVSLSGALKATPKLVRMALSDNPENSQLTKRWDHAIEILKKEKFITWRKSLDELRIWEGSDFDIDEAVSQHVILEKRPLSQILNEICPLAPLIAQRHSYETGNLRFFNRRYYENVYDFVQSKRFNITGDGLVCNILSKKLDLNVDIPVKLDNQKPVVYVYSAIEIEEIKRACVEYTALEKIYKCSPELQTDAVARREVRHRLKISKYILDNLLLEAFTFSNANQLCHIQQVEEIKNQRQFNSRISDLCDIVFSKSIKLKNELLNRNKLTTQGAKAQRLLISAMINNGDIERLGIEGNGPEYSMYASFVEKTGIHSCKDGQWAIRKPHNRSGLSSAWKMVDTFCKSSKDNPRNIKELYDVLILPPYGIKEGVIPVLLASYLIQHMDEMALYQSGTFVPELHEAVFELIVKRPELFTLKYFELTGIKGQLLAEFEKIVGIDSNDKVKKSTLLNIVKPLLGFISNQPEYTKKTHNLSTIAINVRDTLINAREPDILIFQDLPIACGLDIKNKTLGKKDAKHFRTLLVNALREINNAYTNLLAKCKDLMCEAFSYEEKKDEFTDYLSKRARHLGECAEPVLKSFTNAVKETSKPEDEWVEAVAFVVQDKPPKSWDDSDFIQFEDHLLTIAKRFSSLESLRSCMHNSPGADFEARRITITKPDGEGADEVVWISKDKQAKVDNYIAHDILQNYPIKGNKQFLQAVLCALSERLFNLESEDTSDEKRKAGIKNNAKK
jgi:hypothetical protein